MAAPFALTMQTKFAATADSSRNAVIKRLHRRSAIGPILAASRRRVVKAGPSEHPTRDSGWALPRDVRSSLRGVAVTFDQATVARFRCLPRRELCPDSRRTARVVLTLLIQPTLVYRAR